MPEPALLPGRLRVAVVGTGYVGLVTGAGLASVGHAVTCVDVRRDLVDRIARGEPPIHEEGLEELLAKALAAKRLASTVDLESAVAGSNVTILCVGTPSTERGADISQLLEAARAVGAALGPSGPWRLVVVKSTVPPGTTEGPVLNALVSASGRQVGDGLGLAMCPEFLREGRAVRDFLEADRIVIGACDDRSRDAALSLWEPFKCPKVITTPRAAEMIKYASNALLATTISFANEIANLCASVPDLDARDVWRGVHLDRRFSTNGRDKVEFLDYLWHGLGFGGSCFPKDVAALVAYGRSAGVPMPVLEAVLAVNRAQPVRLADLLEQEMQPRDRRVAVLGLAFKPGTDDVRESPALPLIARLKALGASVVAHDPVASSRAAQLPEMEGVEIAPSWEAALDGADACCLVTRWREYEAIPLQAFGRLMRRPLVLDGRGLFDPVAMAAAGVVCRGIGRGPESSPKSPRMEASHERPRR